MKKFSKYSYEDVLEAVKQNTSISGVMRHFGLTPRGSNFSRFKEMFNFFKIKTSHFSRGNNLKPLKIHTKQTFLKEVLIKDGLKWSTSKIKEKLIEFGFKKEVCEKCSIHNVWEGAKLILQLDHINGNSSDNRLTNLRILCPNCHSQTKTYAGRGIKKELLKKRICSNCLCKISRHSKSGLCITCSTNKNRASY